MKRRLVFIVAALLSAGFGACAIIYEVNESIVAAWCGGFFVVTLLIFVFISTIVDSLRKKHFVCAAIEFVFLVAAVVLIAFICDCLVKIDKKQSEIDAVTAIIEQQQDEDERYKILIEEKWPLIDQRFEISQRARLFVIFLNLCILSNVIVSTYNNKDKSYENDDVTKLGGGNSAL